MNTGLQIDRIITGDVRSILPTLPTRSMHCCITSPPYYGLRDYGTAEWIGGDPSCQHIRSAKNKNSDQLITSRKKIVNGSGDEIYRSICKDCGAYRVDHQLGLEESPEAYVKNQLDIYKEVQRILMPTGTFWLNIGDSYWGGKGRSGSGDALHQAQRKKDGASLNHAHQSIGGKGLTRPTDGTHELIRPKDMIGIPWRMAFALQGFAVVPFFKFREWAQLLRIAIDTGDWTLVEFVEGVLNQMDMLEGLKRQGWYLRNDIIWAKNNPMPESVADRCTKSHEFVFLLSKNRHYYYDSKAIEERGIIPAGTLAAKGSESRKNEAGVNARPSEYKEYSGTRNKRDVWSVNTKPFNGAHFATFPEELIVDMVKAGCPEGGTILDPFMGAGTTAVIARKLNRHFIGCELNPKNVKLANNRLIQELGLFI